MRGTRAKLLRKIARSIFDKYGWERPLKNLYKRVKRAYSMGEKI